VSLLVIIVNYRTPAMTLEALTALMRELEGLGDSDVVIVDNGSGDDSVERIRRGIAQRGWSDRVSVLVSDRNGGFAYGNNLAIRASVLRWAIRTSLVTSTS
jgi:GT2 family glycosyltransferase